MQESIPFLFVKLLLEQNEDLSHLPFLNAYKVALQTAETRISHLPDPLKFPQPYKTLQSY